MRQRPSPFRISAHAGVLYVSLGLVLACSIKAQSTDIKTFTHPNNPITVSASWEKASDEEIAKINAEIKVKAASSKRGKPLPVGPSWKLHFWSSGPNGSNYCGWIWLHSVTDALLPDELGNPVIYDAMFPSNDLLLVIYGNNIEVSCDERVPSPTGGEMQVRKGINWGIVYLQDAVSIESAVLKWESATNATAILLDNTGTTNKAAWTRTEGWTKTTPSPKNAGSDSHAQFADIKTFTHTNNPITVSASWEKLSDEEISRRNEEAKEKNKTNPPGSRSGLIGPSWRLHIWSNGPNGSNYCGYVWLFSIVGEHHPEQLGEPVVFDAIFATKDLLLLVVWKPDRNSL